jgi:tetratricopeptide (TPR) repeat protein
MSAHQSRGASWQNPQIIGDLEAGLAYHKAGQRERAEQLYRKVLRRQPDQPDALHLLGLIASGRGRHEYAVQLLSRALRGLPGSADVRRSLGDALRALGRLGEAADHYRAAIALKPGFAQAHCNLAALLIQQGGHEAALEHATRAAELMPELVEAHLNRGAAFAARRRLVEAEAAYRRVLALQSDNTQALSELGWLLTELGRPDEAEAICRHELSLVPRAAPAWSRLGRVLKCLGRFDEARSCFERALELDPELPEAYGGLAILGARAGDEEQLRRLRAVLADPGHPAAARISAGFALGKLLDNADRCDEAFPCFFQANSLHRQLLSASGTRYDRGAFRQYIEGLIETCTPELYATPEHDGNLSELPVFVVGMPRSGTSLIEQIAASHSRVAGAGELPDIGHIVELVQADVQEGREQDPDLALGLADGYVARLQQIGRGAERVIDKMPDNILGLGLVALLFPQARIVFCRRDPRDTCLSCYFQPFNLRFAWDTDLADCGSRALQIERLAEHWRHSLPLRMLTINYEAMVADLEGESRRLIEFLGLDWEPTCLDFHETERPVLTASGWQVRQPLFTRSVGRWRKYERHLGPLLEVLAQGAAGSGPAGESGG